ncbi:MAG: glycosyltransferase family 39 protein [Candidatus Diapherotrites archaeon]
MLGFGQVSGIKNAVKRFGSERVFRIALALLAISALALYSSGISGCFYPMDTPFYLTSAAGIARGQGYVCANMPHPEAATTFPPLAPVVYALPILLFGVDMRATAWAAVLLTAFSIIPAAFIFRKFFSRGISLLLTALLAFSPTIMWYSAIQLSEPPFLLVSLIGIYYALNYAERGGRTEMLLAALFLSLAAYTRVIGLIFLPAVLVYFLAERKLKQGLPLFAAMLLLTLPWLVYLAATPPQSSLPTYADPYKELLSQKGTAGLAEMALTNAGNYAASAIPGAIFFPSGLAGMLIPYPLANLRQAVEFAIFPFALFIFLFGLFCARTEQRKRFLAFLAIIYFITLIFNPAYSAATANRHMFPAVPFLLLFFALGLRRLQGVWMPRRALPAILVLMLVCGSIVSINMPWLMRNRCSDYNYTAFERLANEVVERTPEGAVIWVSQPEKLFLMTGRLSAYHPAGSAGELLAMWQREGVDYVLISPYADPNLKYMDIRGGNSLMPVGDAIQSLKK